MTDTLNTIDPATGKPLKTYAIMSDAQVTDTVEACHKAFEGWRDTPPAQRAQILRAVGQGLRDNADGLAALMTQEMGKLLTQSQQEVALCAAVCDWKAAHGPKALEAEHRDLDGGGKGHIIYAPIGVIYGIQPWNYPAYQVIRYSIANLMAGNGVLLKHAENVTGTGEMLARIYREAGVPAGLFAQLLITHDQSDAVIKHKLVRGVTLTGSPDAGRMVAKQAAKQLKKTVMELGSNDAYIVLEDADLDLAVKTCVMGRIYNNGETCIAAKRFVVVDAVYDQFRDAFVAAMKDLTTGDPTRNDVDLGPMARKDLRDKLHDQVEKSVAHGATILCGGTLPDGAGYYYPATVLEDVTPGQPAYDDELFGPVAALIRAKDQDDAMRIANDSRFGLGGGIFSRDSERAAKLAAERFDTGMVFINDFGLATPNMPFGGVKDSGYGREHGGFGMKEFVNVKAVMIAK
jgi:succinate-semialdehyde dehydrogenase/glutarate-semialdehyde dehydrogenase